MKLNEPTTQNTRLVSFVTKLSDGWNEGFLMNDEDFNHWLSTQRLDISVIQMTRFVSNHFLVLEVVYEISESIQ